MSDASGSKPAATESGRDGFAWRRSGALLRTVLYCTLGGALFSVGYVAYRAVEDRAEMRKGQDRLVALHGLIQPVEKHLAPGYTDQDRGLLADPPSKPEQMLDPDTLVLAHYEGDDDDGERVDWEGFQAHLARATGKKVVAGVYSNSADEVAAIRAGKIQVVALHAADTPYVVNNAGFVPVAVLGTASGASGNHLVIAVSSKSKIKTLRDIRGKKLTCTRPDSITGYRAAIAVLSQDVGMRPGVEYLIHFSFGQRRSISGLASGEFEIAALSDDKLKSMLAEGSVEASDCRVIYESGVIPRLTFGHVYNLKPDLAAKIVRAALDFENQGAAVEAATEKPMRFFAIDYKKDFDFVRKMDDSFDPRFGQTIAKLQP